MKCLVVVPTYNERENIRLLVQKLQQQPSEVHVLIVDDNSPDGTGAVADDLSEAYPGTIFVMHRSRKEGLGRAYIAAFQHVLSLKYDVIVQMDADLSHDPVYLPAFLSRLRECDVVLGSRYIDGGGIANWSLVRRSLSRLANRYVNLVARMPYSDTTSGYKAWRSDALRTIQLDTLISNGYLFQIETTFRALTAGLCIKELPIVFCERKAGRSKLALGTIAEAVWGVLRLWGASYRKGTWKGSTNTFHAQCVGTAIWAILVSLAVLTLLL